MLASKQGAVPRPRASPLPAIRPFGPLSTTLFPHHHEKRTLMTVASNTTRTLGPLPQSSSLTVPWLPLTAHNRSLDGCGHVAGDDLVKLPVLADCIHPAAHCARHLGVHQGLHHGAHQQAAADGGKGLLGGQEVCEDVSRGWGWGIMFWEWG